MQFLGFPMSGKISAKNFFTLFQRSRSFPLRLRRLRPGTIGMTGPTARSRVEVTQQGDWSHCAVGMKG